MNTSAFRLPTSDLVRRFRRALDALEAWERGDARHAIVEQPPALAVPLAIGFIVAAFAIIGRIDMEVETAAAEERDHVQPSITLELDLRDCSPPGVALSPRVSVSLTANQPTVIGCVRYAAGNLIPAGAVLADGIQ